MSDITEEIARLRADIARLEAAAPLSARETAVYLDLERRLMALEAAAIRKG
jgi:hypothetical protein